VASVESLLSSVRKQTKEEDQQVINNIYQTTDGNKRVFWMLLRQLHVEPDWPWDRALKAIMPYDGYKVYLGRVQVQVQVRVQVRVRIEASILTNYRLIGTENIKRAQIGIQRVHRSTTQGGAHVARGGRQCRSVGVRGDAPHTHPTDPTARIVPVGCASSRERRSIPRNRVGQAARVDF
jgi:hypothetical protein